MSSIKKLYLSEMRRIKRQGIDVCFPRKLFANMRKECGHESVGYFIRPSTILINPKIKTISARLKILLHEEGHWLDKKKIVHFCENIVPNDIQYAELWN